MVLKVTSVESAEYDRASVLTRLTAGRLRAAGLNSALKDKQSAPVSAEPAAGATEVSSPYLFAFQPAAEVADVFQVSWQIFTELP